MISIFYRAHAGEIRRQAAQELKNDGSHKNIAHRISRSSVSSLSGISSSGVMGPPPPPRKPPLKASPKQHWKKCS